MKAIKKNGVPGMVYIDTENAKHIWTIKCNPANGLYFIKNKRTGKEYHLFAGEFVRGQGNYNDITESFPGYVHAAVWFNIQ